MHQGSAAWCATGAEAGRPYWLALLAEASGKVGQLEAGLTVLAEALAVTNDRGERRWEAERIGSRGSDACGKPSRTRPRRRPAFSRLSP